MGASSIFSTRNRFKAILYKGAQNNPSSYEECAPNLDPLLLAEVNVRVVSSFQVSSGEPWASTSALGWYGRMTRSRPSLESQTAVAQKVSTSSR